MIPKHLAILVGVLLFPGFALAQAPSASFTTTVIGNAPVAEWLVGPNAGITGTTVADASGNGNTATVVNGPLSFPAAGASFTGDTQYIDAPTPTVNYAAFTVLVWFNASTFTSIDGGFGASRLVANSHTYADNKGFDLAINSGDGGGTFDVGNGTASTRVGWTQTLTAGSWYCYVGVYDGATAKVYVNGTQVGSMAFAGGALAAGTGPDINIARNGVYNGDYYSGTLYRVRIYNQALSAGQVVSSCNSTTPPTILTVVVSSAASITGPFTNGQTVAPLQGVWSDGSSFAGSFTIPSQPAGNYFGISGSNVVLTSAGASAFNALGGVTVENLTVAAQQ